MSRLIYAGEKLVDDVLSCHVVVYPPEPLVYNHSLNTKVIVESLRKLATTIEQIRVYEPDFREPVICKVPYSAGEPHISVASEGPDGSAAKRVRRQ